MSFATREDSDSFHCREDQHDDLTPLKLEESLAVFSEANDNNLRCGDQTVDQFSLHEEDEHTEIEFPASEVLGIEASNLNFYPKERRKQTMIDIEKSLLNSDSSKIQKEKASSYPSQTQPYPTHSVPMGAVPSLIHHPTPQYASAPYYPSPIAPAPQSHHYPPPHAALHYLPHPPSTYPPPPSWGTHATATEYHPHPQAHLYPPPAQTYGGHHAHTYVAHNPYGAHPPFHVAAATQPPYHVPAPHDVASAALLPTNLHYPPIHSEAPMDTAKFECKVHPSDTAVALPENYAKNKESITSNTDQNWQQHHPSKSSTNQTKGLPISTVTTSKIKVKVTASADKKRKQSTFLSAPASGKKPTLPKPSCAARKTKMTDEDEEKEKALKLQRRRERKNTQSRYRAVKLKERIRYIQTKPMSERTEEEITTLSIFEERRQRKNDRSRERAMDRKVEVKRILDLPKGQWTDSDQKFVSLTADTKFRKNEGDRLRRKKMKEIMTGKNTNNGIKTMKKETSSVYDCLILTAPGNNSKKSGTSDWTGKRTPSNTTKVTRSNVLSQTNKSTETTVKKNSQGHGTEKKDITNKSHKRTHDNDFHCDLHPWPLTPYQNMVTEHSLDMSPPLSNVSTFMDPCSPANHLRSILNSPTTPPPTMQNKMKDQQTPFQPNESTHTPHSSRSILQDILTPATTKKSNTKKDRNTVCDHDALKNEPSSSGSVNILKSGGDGEYNWAAPIMVPLDMSSATGGISSTFHNLEMTEMTSPIRTSPLSLPRRRSTSSDDSGVSRRSRSPLLRILRKPMDDGGGRSGRFATGGSNLILDSSFVEGDKNRYIGASAVGSENYEQGNYHYIEKDGRDDIFNLGRSAVTKDIFQEHHVGMDDDNGYDLQSSHPQTYPPESSITVSFSVDTV